MDFVCADENYSTFVKYSINTLHLTKLSFNSNKDNVYNKLKNNQILRKPHLTFLNGHQYEERIECICKYYTHTLILFER